MNAFAAITIFLLSLLISFVSLSPTQAQDLTITCNTSQCLSNPEDFNFNEISLVPGQTIFKLIKIVNNSGDSCNLSLTASPNGASANLGEQMFTAINNNISDVYGATLNNEALSLKNINHLFIGSADLGSIPESSSIELQWLITFNKDAGNEYQGQTLSFNFSTNFTCLDSLTESNLDSRTNNNSRNSNTSTTPSLLTPGTTLVLGTTSFFDAAGLNSSLIQQEKAVSDIELVQAQTGEIQGVAKEICTNPWWWPLLSLAQGLILIVVKRFLRQNNKLSILQIIITLLFAYLSWILFCGWLEVLLSIVVGVTLLWLSKDKPSQSY